MKHKSKCNCKHSDVHKDIVYGTHNVYEVKICIRCNTILSSKKI